MTTGLCTTATSCCEELRYTVMFLSATVGLPAESTNERNTTEWILPSAGSVGGTTVSAKETAADELEAETEDNEITERRINDATAKDATRVLIKVKSRTPYLLKNLQDFQSRL
jgi:hypothetical protein